MRSRVLLCGVALAALASQAALAQSRAALGAMEGVGQALIEHSYRLESQEQQAREHEQQRRLLLLQHQLEMERIRAAAAVQPPPAPLTPQEQYRQQQTAKLAQIHPDWYTVIRSPEFLQWKQQQYPELVQEFDRTLDVAFFAGFITRFKQRPQ